MIYFRFNPRNETDREEATLRHLCAAYAAQGGNAAEFIELVAGLARR